MFNFFCSNLRELIQKSVKYLTPKIFDAIMTKNNFFISSDMSIYHF